MTERKVFAWSLEIGDYNKLHEMAKESGVSISQFLKEKVFTKEAVKVEDKSIIEHSETKQKKQSKKPTKVEEPQEEEIVVFDDSTN